MILNEQRIFALFLGISVLFLPFDVTFGMAGGVSEDIAGCVTIVSQPAGARLSISGSMLLGGRSPSTFCSLKPGEKYRLTVEKRGFERRSGILFLAENSNEAVLQSYLASNTIKSLAIPGLGQISSGEVWKGVQNFIFSAGTAVGAFFAYEEYKDHRDEYRLYYKELDTALSEEEKATYSEGLRLAAVRTNKSREYMFITAGIFGWTYLTNILETFLGSLAPREVKRTGRSVTLKIPKKSLSKALARSFLSPGLGQKYVGHNVRGFLFQAFFLGASFFAADSWRNYQMASAEYDIASTKLEGAGSLQEIKEAREELETVWEDLRDKEKVRNASLITAASIWVLNILDVINSSDLRNKAGLNLAFYSNEHRPFTGIAISF